ncbi:MAG: hypothetical protein Q8R60_00220 [Mycobacteriales bacterium]|nr:hypothetical protein [Mycobacteriales bacterium]
MSEHVILPFRPVEGWRRASTARRALAVSALPLVLLWAVLLAAAPGRGDVVTAVTGVTVGPVAFWCLARVLRPHEGDGLERQLRHALAAASTCLGTAVIVGIAVDTKDGDFLGLFVVAATLGFCITVPWGVAAVVVRAVRTPVPAARYSTPAGGTTVLPAVGRL